MWEGFGVGNHWVYWTLRLILIAVLIYAGYGISYRKPKDFNKYAWIVGIFYSLIEGLRWMRGADYYHYYNDIVTLFGQFPGIYGRGTITPDPEFLYDCWVTGFHYSGLPFWIAFVIYSALLIWGLLLVLKQFPKAAVWVLPFFFIITVNQTENVIRQFFAASFILFAYYFYLRRKKSKMWLMLIIAPLIHYSAIIPEFGFVLLCLLQRSKWMVRRLRSKLMLACLLAVFVVTYFFWDSSVFTILADFMSNNIDMGDDKAAGYINNADRWLTDEGNLSLIFHGQTAGIVGRFSQASQFLSYLIIIWGGFIAMRKDSRLFVAFFLTFTALIIKNISGGIELYSRIYDWFSIFIPLIMGCILSLKSLKKGYRYSILGLFIVYFFWYNFMSSILGVSNFGYGFIWDADVNIW